MKFERLLIPGNAGSENFPEEWHLKTNQKVSNHLTFWDTFEWGIWFGGYLLYQCEDVYHLCSREDGWLSTELCKETIPGRPRFWSDFGTMQMQTALKPMLGLRSLSVIAELFFNIWRSELRNNEGKIVCRLEWSSVSTAKQAETELIRTCRVLPLRGYEHEASRVFKHLKGFSTGIAGEELLNILFRQGEHTPQTYTLRPFLGLRPETPAREAAGQITRELLKIANSNIPGILADLDTEFLHDYRICIRKIRSLLSLLKHVYPEEDILKIRTMLGNLARQTNQLRDLDVYILTRDECCSLLPPELRPSLEKLYSDLMAERQQEFHRTTTIVRKRSQQKTMQYLESFFAEGAIHKPSLAANLPIGTLAFRNIYRRYRKICQLAEGVDTDTPDNMLHKIRIECKKLRYLMEFFSELIHHKDEPVMLRLLRRLQGRLGEFNDVSVQQRTLLNYCEQKKCDGDMALGIGGLISILYQRQQRMRGGIKQALIEFCDISTATSFKRIFKLPKSARQ